MERRRKIRHEQEFYSDESRFVSILTEHREFRDDPSATRYRFRGLHFSMRSRSHRNRAAVFRVAIGYSRVFLVDSRRANNRVQLLEKEDRREFPRVARRRRRVSHCLGDDARVCFSHSRCSLFLPFLILLMLEQGGRDSWQVIRERQVFSTND